MKVTPAVEVPQQAVEMEGASGCQVRWLIGEPDGAPNFAMRQFEVAPGGHTPRHHHPYEHEVFVVEGEGIVRQGGEAGDVEHALKPGTVVYVGPDEIHQFRNTGETPLKFLCLVPHSSAQLPVTSAPECASVKS